MNVQFLDQFNRDVNRLQHASVKRALSKTIEEIKSANSLSEIRNIKKLQGFRSAYRVRIGDYRLGFFLTGNTIEFARILNRKEIYRYFP
jgi:mRNA interferase RelE/StbE